MNFKVMSMKNSNRFSDNNGVYIFGNYKFDLWYGSEKTNQNKYVYTGSIYLIDDDIGVVDFLIWDNEDAFDKLKSLHSALKENDIIAGEEAYGVIFDFVMNNIKPNFVAFLSYVANDAYTKGQKDKQKEIRTALGY